LADRPAILVVKIDHPVVGRLEAVIFENLVMRRHGGVEQFGARIDVVGLRIESFDRIARGGRALEIDVIGEGFDHFVDARARDALFERRFKQALIEVHAPRIFVLAAAGLARRRRAHRHRHISAGVVDGDRRFELFVRIDRNAADPGDMSRRRLIILQDDFLPFLDGLFAALGAERRDDGRDRILGGAVRAQNILDRLAMAHHHEAFGPRLPVGA
jgi:hypothetical protein